MSSRPPLVLNAGNLQQLQSGDWADIGVPYMMHKNRIINGDFRIWQRGSGLFDVTASGTYYPDRWLYLFDGTGVAIESSRQTFTPGQTDVPDNPAYFCRSAITSLAPSGQTYSLMGQRIEGVNTFAGQTITVSFWVKADTSRTIQTHFEQSFGTGGSPSSLVSTSFTDHSIGTTWTKVTQTLTLPSISGQTLGTNGDDNLAFYISLPLNTTFTLDVAHVQIEYGSNATYFEFRHVAHELALCQRYFLRTGNGAPMAFNGSDGSKSTVICPVPLRASPTCALSTTSPQAAIVGIGSYTGSSSTISLVNTGAATGTGSNNLAIFVNGWGNSIPSGSQTKLGFFLDDYFLLSAEL